MAKQRDREEFVALLTREGVPLDVCRKIMRHAATYQRLQEVACSSEAADRDRVPCPRKGSIYRACLCMDYRSKPDGDNGHGDVPRFMVRERQIENAVEGLLAPFHVMPVFSGDPRGATIKLKVPSGKTNDWGQVGICVP